MNRKRIVITVIGGCLGCGLGVYSGTGPVGIVKGIAVIGFLAFLFSHSLKSGKPKNEGQT